MARPLQAFSPKQPINDEGSDSMTSPASWLEQQICKSVAAALLARNEFFELLADATISPVRLARARATWRHHAENVQTLNKVMRPI
jgi:hypothetical protein